MSSALTASPSLSAALRAQLRGLRLQTRRPPLHNGLGLHAGRHIGAGLEFAQYRAYEPGDEPRRVDWKLYARSDRYFVREATRESPLTVWLLIDASASMRHHDRARPDWSKLDAAKTLALCLADIALQHGDAFGLATIGGNTPGGVQLLSADSSLAQRTRLQLALHALQAGGGGTASAVLRPLWQRWHADTLLILLSDDFDDALLDAITDFAASGRDVHSIGLLGADERDFPYPAGHLFRDPETGHERQIDAPALRAEFLARFAAARQALQQRCDTAGMRHLDYVLDAPLAEPLRALYGPAGRGTGPHP